MGIGTEIVRQFFVEYAKHDTGALADLLQPHASWTVMSIALPGSGIHSGRERILQDFLLPIRAQFEPVAMDVRVDSIVSNDRMAMAESRTVGKMKSGQIYRNRYCWSFDIEDGRIASVREYFDTLYTALILKVVSLAH